MSSGKKASKSRSQATQSSSIGSQRRQTAPSTAGHSGYLEKQEFVRRHVVAGLRSDAELEWEKQQQSCLEVDAEDDESFASSKGKQQSSPNTSVDSKERAHVRRGGR
jgi:Tfp pilus assembly protein PilW